MAQQLTNEILNAALENLTSKRQDIDTQIAEVRRLLGHSTNGPSAKSQTPRRKHTISVAGRQAIAAAQRRRWAEKKGSSQAAGETRRPKRKLSAEGRRNIVNALKKRWAAERAGKATSTQAAKKSSSRATAKKTAASAAAGNSQ